MYHVNNAILQAPSSLKDLGIIMDSALTYRDHIHNVVARARSRCALYLKVFKSRNPTMMMRFFTTYVRPTLEYGSQIWSPIGSLEINALEGVQRYFTNKVPSCRFLPYSQRLLKLSLHSLHHRRMVADQVFLHSMMTGDISVSLSPHLNLQPPAITRGGNLKIVLPSLNYLRSRQNFITRTAPMWNKFNLLNFNFDVSTYVFRSKAITMIQDPFLN